ncbi:YjiH family protein [Moraxella bovis]|uniref:YjiH family protein n=1 Tax=Moraxella bovis TaxID=476 RepID=A0AAQ2Q6B1_MORBO|nr:YjiH family protein [Moraxella bovis]AWY20418.1 YjiH family protein [Moraxella bovis]OOR88203.1 histidine transporter [Moraxella bovis]UYZ76912.1 YjiH family protein [Moraxella bovis]UYZ77138.1 YjiH family protein [Moraxella bovis]UYZ82373.1 YjiH family protein [Moraxella bovis]
MKNQSNTLALIKLIGFSLLGIFLFFVPIDIAGISTITFDHMASYLVREQKGLAIVLLFALMIYGVAKPFINKSFNANLTNRILTILKILGLILSILFITKTAPDFLMQKDMLPFLFEKLALPVGMIVPIGAVMLAFLLGFGLLEAVGVLMQPVMKPLFKTSGKSAIDAVASFVGSYSVGLLITDRVYQQGAYSAKEAVIIATGFSTVSTAFMVIIAKTLELMLFWGFYFWSCLFITFLVTAITARIPPISRFSDEKTIPDNDKLNAPIIKVAINTGINTAKNAPPLYKLLWDNFIDGVNMASAIVPSIIAIGLIGLLLEKHTPVFDVLGVVLYPFALIGGLSEPMTVAKGLSSGLAEMFLPALLLAKADLLTRYVTAVVSVSGIVFFSAMIPCVLATKIPLSVGKMVLIWFIRVALSIVLAIWFGYLAISMGWLV